MSNIVKFDFHGDELDVARYGDDLFVSVRRVCEALGVDVTRQLQKLKDKPWATMAVMSMVAEDGKNRQVACVHVDGLPMWLATIDPSRVNESVRPKLERFQLEAAKALRDHFIKAPPAHLPQLAASNDVNIERAKFLERALDAVSELGTVPRDIISVYRVKAAQMATGEDLSMLLPSAKETSQWFTPTQIGQRLGVSAQRVGLIVSALNIRGDIDGLCRSVLNKAEHSDKTVTSYLYSPRAVELIERELKVKQLPVG